ncbi:UNVERIFIED_CONTAM: hypothetical protein FKN15_024833 [Acipenser sinensis]
MEISARWISDTGTPCGRRQSGKKTPMDQPPEEASGICPQDSRSTAGGQVIPHSCAGRGHDGGSQMDAEGSVGGKAVQAGLEGAPKVLLVPRVQPGGGEVKCPLREWEMKQDWGEPEVPGGLEEPAREKQAVRDHKQPQEALLREVKKVQLLQKPDISCGEEMYTASDHQQPQEALLRKLKEALQ